MSQKIKALSNKIQLRQRGVLTMRKSLNEIESQISDLDAAKEIAKQGKEMRKDKNVHEATSVGQAPRESTPGNVGGMTVACPILDQNM